MIRVSSVFADRMVLQRDTRENTVWGYTDPGAEVSVGLRADAPEDKETGSFAGKTTAGEDGAFCVELPSRPGGGSYTLSIESGSGSLTFHELTFGDVFVCGGQSNMVLPLARTLERYEEELREFSEDGIRFFKVPEVFDFHGPHELIEGGAWYCARQPELLEFGAAAFFAAKELHEKTGVPIGIYNTAIGGTPIKAWASEESLHRLNLHEEEFELCRDDERVAFIQEYEAKEDAEWRRSAAEAFAADPFETEEERKAQGVFSVPGFFNGPDLTGRPMAVRFWKEVELDEAWSRMESKLYLGALIDSDITLVNGETAGETGYLYPPRIYRLPEGRWRAGTNLIEIRLLVFRDRGGFMPGMHYKLRRADGVEISLEGEWQYRVVKEMRYLQNMTFFAYRATGVYNAMIHPLHRQQIRGFFFYQGESNVDSYETYQEEFEAVIGDWRKVWGKPELPFIFVQIAGFADGLTEYGERGAYLCEEQRKCTRLPATAMVQAYDLGEFNELHPTNKKEVGRRLALAAQALVYGEGSYRPGPQKKEILRTDDYVEVTFDEPLILSHGIGVLTGPDRDETRVRGFVYFEDDKRYAAEAEQLSETKIRVFVPWKADAFGYAWNDCPLEANLYSADRLPVVPFLETRR